MLRTCPRTRDPGERSDITRPRYRCGAVVASPPRSRPCCWRGYLMATGARPAWGIARRSLWSGGRCAGGVHVVCQLVDLDGGRAAAEQVLPLGRMAAIA